MINKVQPNVPVDYTNSISQVEGKPETLNEKSRHVDGSSAEVSLSGDALALQRIMQAVKDTPDVRDDVVQAIQNQIETGTYRVNAEGLAERLLPLLK
jgi:negative regulator of flagellin synthesis FlgM